MEREGGPSSLDPPPPPALTEAVPKISVVVPVKNEARRVATCLSALMRQDVRPAEILVVDGHSTDDTVAIARRFGARILFEDDATRAGACQVGVEAATGDLVAFTDADCVPEPAWLASLVAGFSDEVVGVGGRIINEGETFWQRSIDVALNTFVGSANSVQGRVFSNRRTVSSISGCNSMYRRADLLSAGGFRRDLVTTEDTELNRRLATRGRLLYVPDAIVRHRHQRGLRDFARRMFQYGFGRGQSLLPGFPLVVALGAAGAVAVAVVLPLEGLLLLALYLAAVFVSSAKPAATHRDARLLGALPVIFVIEHAAYAVGFWRGLLRFLADAGRRAPAPRREGL